MGRRLASPVLECRGRAHGKGVRTRTIPNPLHLRGSVKISAQEGTLPLQTMDDTPPTMGTGSLKLLP